MNKNICLRCKEEFISHSHHHQKFCSISCAVMYNPPNKVGRLSSRWKGGRHIDCDGYWRTLIIGLRKYIPEQRKIMERYLERKLKPGEIVHHINGIKNDNRMENLRLMTRSEHNILHSKTRSRDEGGRYG